MNSCYGHLRSNLAARTINACRWLFYAFTGAYLAWSEKAKEHVARLLQAVI